MRDLPTVRENSTIREALEVIDAGAAEIAFVIASNSRVCGTVTDGDVRRGLLRGLGLDAPVTEVANRGFVSVAQGVSRAEVLDLMRSRTLSQIPVLDRSGRLVGLHLLQQLVGGMPKPNLAIVMAGGRGRRLRPITDRLPKPMVKVAGRPIIERIVLHLVGFGVRRIFLAINYLGEMIETHFGDGSDFGCSIEYLREEQPLGTAGALRLLPEQPKHPVIVLNGDLITQVNLDSMLRFHKRGGFGATVGLRQHAYEVPFGVVELEENRILSISEKPTYAWQVNCGIYVIEPDLVSAIPAERFFDMTDLVAGCFDSATPVGGYPVEGDWIDVGRGADLSMARGEDQQND
jgi:dTDP-glucose pyrophosphorylase